MATIYLSSTYEDLQDHRRAVIEALRKSGYQVIAMKDYVATGPAARRELGAIRGRTCCPGEAFSAWRSYNSSF